MNSGAAVLRRLSAATTATFKPMAAASLCSKSSGTRNVPQSAATEVTRSGCSSRHSCRGSRSAAWPAELAEFAVPAEVAEPTEPAELAEVAGPAELAEPAEVNVIAELAEQSHRPTTTMAVRVSYRMPPPIG